MKLSEILKDAKNRADIEIHRRDWKFGEYIRAPAVAALLEIAPELGNSEDWYAHQSTRQDSSHDLEADARLICQALGENPNGLIELDATPAANVGMIHPDAVVNGKCYAAQWRRYMPAAAALRLAHADEIQGTRNA